MRMPRKTSKRAHRGGENRRAEGILSRDCGVQASGSGGLPYRKTERTNMVRSRRRHYKIEDAAAATLAERMRDLKIRAGHYASKARKFADRIVTLTKILKCLGMVCAAVMTALIAAALQMREGQGEWISWSLIACGLLASIITAIQLFIVDEKSSVTLFAVVREFSTVVNNVARLQARSRALTREDALHTLEAHYAEYLSLKDKHLERIERTRFYYYYRFFPGPTHKIRTGFP